MKVLTLQDAVSCDPKTWQDVGYQQGLQDGINQAPALDNAGAFDSGVFHGLLIGAGAVSAVWLGLIFWRK